MFLYRIVSFCFISFHFISFPSYLCVKCTLYNEHVLFICVHHRSINDCYDEIVFLFHELFALARSFLHTPSYNFSQSASKNKNLLIMQFCVSFSKQSIYIFPKKKWLKSNWDRAQNLLSPVWQLRRRRKQSLWKVIASSSHDPDGAAHTPAK